MFIAYEDDEVRVFINEDALELSVELRVRDEWVETDRGTFPNLKVLSASFRDAVGYGKAVDILRANKVPKESLLWDLNHSNPYRDENGRLV